MRIIRVGWLVVCAAAAIPAGCAGAGFSPEPRGDVSLAGMWKLDHAASDDPQKLLARMRSEALRLMQRRQSAPPAPRPGMRGGVAGGSQAQEPSAEEELGLPAGNPQTPRPDPLLRSPMAHIVMATAARGDYLTVRQRPAELVFDYGTTRRTFTPGTHSVVSAEGGVGDQTSGWKGGEYVIEIKAQLGPTVTESYALSKDGRQLVDRLHIGAGELPAVNLTRVYNPTRETAPPQLPVSD